MASNPFVAFRDLPLESRYRFLLDEAQFFIMNFIKGPVCRGQVAVDVIQDHFWVSSSTRRPTPRSSASMRCCARPRACPCPPSRAAIRPDRPVAEYSRQQRALPAGQEPAAGSTFGSGPAKIDLSLIWDGDGHNRNAALTIFRHFDNASVVKGLVGEPPKTAWVIGYALFERIYYLLVAGYDVFGNVGHQLQQPPVHGLHAHGGRVQFPAAAAARAAPGARATSGIEARPARSRIMSTASNASSMSKAPLPYRTNDPQRELYGLLQPAPGAGAEHALRAVDVADARLRSELVVAGHGAGRQPGLVAGDVVLRVDGPAGVPRYFTLLRNTAHANVATWCARRPRLLPDENTLTVVPGFIGAYPNAIYRMQRGELPAFERRSRPGLGGRLPQARRPLCRAAHEPAFWAASDALHEAYGAWAPLEAGLFDYNRLENRWLARGLSARRVVAA